MAELLGYTTSGGFQPSVTINVPGEAEDGHLLFLSVSANDFDSLDELEGWEVLQDVPIEPNSRVWTLYRWAEEEPEDYTLSFNGEHWHFAVMTAWSGVESILLQDSAVAASASSLDFPSLQAPADSTLLMVAFHWSETTKAFPEGLEEIVNLPRGLALAYEVQELAGQTTEHTLTCGTTGRMAALTILLEHHQEEPGPPPPLPPLPRAESKGWRFHAMDAVTREWLHRDVPLGNVEIEYALSGPMSITATITPEVESMKRDDGSPLFDVWGTLLFAEESGLLRGGGILVDSSFNGQSWDLEVMGFSGYLHGEPLVDTRRFGGSSAGTSGHGVDPLDVVRDLWQHSQTKTNANLHVTVDGTTTNYRVGSWHNAARLPNEPGQSVNRAEVNDPIEFAEVLDGKNQKPVSATGKTVYWQHLLAWYDNLEMGAVIQSLSEKTPFDYVEEYSWSDSQKSDVKMHLRIGHPRLGTRKSNLSFVVGDNIYDVLSIQESGEDYANSVHYYGSGEGSSQLRAESTEVTRRLRRTATHVDTSITSRSDLQARARGERLKAEIDLDIDSFSVIQHDNAPLGSFGVGDDIFVRSDFGWRRFEKWCRVTALRVDIETGLMQVTCQRSDTFSYTPIQNRFVRP